MHSEVQLLQCTIATRLPSGVVTRSMASYTFCSSFSRTIIANTLVPADTLPVLLATELVAAIPVPASPSGGQSGMPACRVPVGSNRAAPSSVRVPAASPAVSTFGMISRSFHGNFLSATSSSNCSIIFALKSPVSISIGNIPEASPTPRTRSPVSFQCT